MSATAELRRAAQRAVTTTPWLTSRHSFSFGDHYDPSNTHHGLLLVNNDDIVAPDTGFDTHPHRDMEIVTWVLDGALAHQDSLGNRGDCCRFHAVWPFPPIARRAWVKDARPSRLSWWRHARCL